MADLTITAANVVQGSDAKTEDGRAGTTITAGQVVYGDGSSVKYLLADADGVGAAKKPRGIALNGAAANQPLKVQRSGDITIGATLVPGTTYYLSGTAGGICPLADVGAGEDYCIIGIAKSTTVLSLILKSSGVAASA